MQDNLLRLIILFANLHIIADYYKLSKKDREMVTDIMLRFYSVMRKTDLEWSYQYDKTRAHILGNAH